MPPSLAAPDIAFAADPSDEKRFLEVRAARHAKRLLTPPKQRGFFSMASPDTAASNVRKYSIRRPAANLLPLHLYAKLPCRDAANIRPDWPLDVSCPAVSLNLSQAFSETAEGRWLARHAPLYGFIIRYPKGKEHLTKILAEPWHIRYVTRSLALCLTLTGQVLEEYYACCER